MNIAIQSPEQRASAWLSDGGLRPTRQRLSLAELLIGDGQDRHVTAESLFDLTHDTEAKVSLATVYNTLGAFCEAGLMREVSVDGHRSYFDTRVDDHSHFYWEDEGILTDAPVGSVKFESLPDLPEGAEISKIDVVIRLRRS